MTNKAFMITRKEDKFNGVVKNLNEENVTITWEDETEETILGKTLKEAVKKGEYAIEEVELVENTPAQDSIKTHSSPDATTSGEADGNPKTKIDWIRSILGNLADCDLTTLSRLQDQVIALVGGEGERAGLGSAAGKNQSSVDMHPSGAEGKGKWSGMESVIPKLQKEEQDAIFGETELTEDAKAKMTSLFETAISTRLTEEVVKLTEKYDAELNEAIDNISNSITEGLRDYLDHTINEWLESNRVAVESTLRTELTNEFLVKLKGLFTESFVDIPEDKVDILKSAVTEIDQLKEDLNNQVNESIELQKVIKGLKRDQAISEAALGLTLPQRDKLKKLAETTEYKDEKDFAEKLSSIKKDFLKESTTTTSNVITETFEPKTTEVISANPVIQAMGKSIF